MTPTLERSSGMEQLGMFPELEARETPSVELAATTADGRAMEAATGIVPEWFVESALGRCRVVFTTE